MASRKRSFNAAFKLKVVEPAKNSACSGFARLGHLRISTDIITSLFLVCGISACVNGTEDASIHCLKSGGVASEVLPTINENTATLLIFLILRDRTTRTETPSQTSATRRKS